MREYDPERAGFLAGVREAMHRNIEHLQKIETKARDCTAMLGVNSNTATATHIIQTILRLVIDEMRAEAMRLRKAEPEAFSSQDIAGADRIGRKFLGQDTEVN